MGRRCNRVQTEGIRFLFQTLLKFCSLSQFLVGILCLKLLSFGRLHLRWRLNHAWYRTGRPHIRSLHLRLICSCRFWHLCEVRSSWGHLFSYHGLTCGFGLDNLSRGLRYDFNLFVCFRATSSHFWFLSLKFCFLKFIKFNSENININYPSLSDLDHE